MRGNEVYLIFKNFRCRRVGASVVVIEGSGLGEVVYIDRGLVN